MASTPAAGQLEDQLRSMILNNTVAPQSKSTAPPHNRSEPPKAVRNNQNRNNNQSSRSQQPPSNTYQRNAPVQHQQPQTVNNHAQQRSVAPGNQQQPQRWYQPQVPTNTSQTHPPPYGNRQGANLKRNPDANQEKILRGDQGTRGNFRSAPSKFTPLSRPQQPTHDQFNLQCQYIEQTAAQWLPQLELSQDEFASKDHFRVRLEQACQQDAVATYSTDPPAIRLASFGSLSSGFAMPGSDMDLALVTTRMTPELPRLFEKTLLNLGHGARLLTRTRVPIIKVCESPSAELYAALLEERQKWDNMTPEEQVKYDQTGRQDEEVKEEGKEGQQPNLELDVKEDGVEGGAQDTEGNKARRDKQSSKTAEESVKLSGHSSEQQQILPTIDPSQQPILPAVDLSQQPGPQSAGGPHTTTQTGPRAQRPQRAWYREKRLGPLDFPKSGVGIQCDINFSNPLGLHNTLLLRCYSHCDVRVRLMVLFVKAWASRRKINSGYSGTLSSYGYVLMVLHFLVNVARPPVCPNMQLARRTNIPWNSINGDPNSVCEGYDVRFWRNEAEILALAAKGMLSHNQQALGVLIRGFFQYYAHQGYDAPNGGFSWTQEVLSLRTQGGLMSKEMKGWTGAKTTMQDKKEIRHRYLFAIEDPFELDHNVARTVTHWGIVAIRDEFRRAWRILLQAGRGPSGSMQDGDLFDLVEDVAPPKVVGKEDKDEVDVGSEGVDAGGQGAVVSVPSAPVG